MIEWLKRLFGRKTKTKYVWPKAVDAQCREALDLARRVCRENGINVAEKSGRVEVRFRLGTKRNPNGWSWYSTIHKRQVMGYVEGPRHKQVIHYAHQPGSIVHGWRHDGLAHELAHTFLIRNENNHTHDPRLAGKIFGWHND
jgi:hypothetical protein